MTADRAVIAPPTLDGGYIEAAHMLKLYGFERQHAPEGSRWFDSYVLELGPVTLWVRLGPPCALERSICGSPFRRWSIPLDPEPMAVATEAAWFVAVLTGLTPPVIGGRLITDRNP